MEDMVEVEVGEKGREEMIDELNKSCVPKLHNMAPLSSATTMTIVEIQLVVVENLTAT